MSCAVSLSSWRRASANHFFRGLQQMAKKFETVLPALIEKHHRQLLDDWLKQQRGDHAAMPEDAGARQESALFLDELRKGAAQGQLQDINATDWASMREVLAQVCRARALKGIPPAQTAMFVFSLKGPIFALLRRELSKDAEQLGAETWAATLLLDKLGLHTMDLYQKTREEIIARQQEELLELSTPVVRLWDGIVAVPLIGTLDSSRTQVVMENLLQQIVTTGAEIAIIDITGVPTVDTLVAQHLLKTVSAARLMGADCIISGIRPQIAQTIVHLGIDLSVVSKSTMAGAFKVALQRLGKVVVERSKHSPAAE
jgi:rsbT co-antagonist protein RsbR